MKTNTRTTTLLACLILAPLALADGNITVDVQGKDLVITGDDQANSITVFNEGVDVRIKGNNTTVNGENGSFNFALPKRRIRIDMRGGGDSIDISAELDLGDVDVSLGDGDGESFFVGYGGTGFDDLTVSNSGGGGVISVYDATISGSLRVNGGAGNEIVQVAMGYGAITVGKSVVIDVGEGNNSVTLEEVDCDGKVTVDLGNGSDDVRIARCEIAKSFKMKTGDGGKVVQIEDSTFGKPVKITGGDGGLFLTSTRDQFPKGVKVKTGGGDDVTNFDEATVGGALKVSTGGGVDSISVFNGTSLTKGASLKAGDGGDQIAMSNSTAAKKVKALLQDGDDFVNIFGNTFEKGLLVNGGAGTDEKSNDVEANNTLSGGKYVEKSVEIQD